MTLIRAMSTALSGLSAQQFQLETIGDNLANATTTAYKAERVDFKTLLSDTLRPGSEPEGNLGGIDPLQIGLGVRVGAVHRDLTQGAIVPTGFSTDLALDGTGFFILQDAGGNLFYTRDGSFGLNAQNEFVDPVTGARVLGLSADLTTFTIPVGSPLGPLVIPIGTLTVGAATLVDFTVLPDGTIQGIFNDASTRDLGRVMLARFVNPDGLEHRGDSLFRVTPASGDAIVGAPGTQGLGNVVGGALEESNVDFAEQFTSLIGSQRAFQANARVLSAADAMVAELVNLV